MRHNCKAQPLKNNHKFISNVNPRSQKQTLTTKSDLTLSASSVRGPNPLLLKNPYLTNNTTHRIVESGEPLQQSHFSYKYVYHCLYNMRKTTSLTYGAYAENTNPTLLWTTNFPVFGVKQILNHKFFYRLTRSIKYPLTQQQLARLFLSFSITWDLNPIIQLTQCLLWRVKVPRHKLVFRWLRVIIGKLFNQNNKMLSGLYLELNGKLSVTGNKRTRSLKYRHGVGRLMSFSSNIKQQFFILRTTTGCIGGRVTIIFR